MSKDHYEEKYTNPELRRRLKDEILQSDKGGKAGQWSARKSQILVREYEAQGGGYQTSEKDEAAHSLEEWEEQNWQTEDGSDRARNGNITKRYLPKAVWDKLSASEKQEAERSKEEASKKGAQYVDWTPAIKKAMHEYEQSMHKSKSGDSKRKNLQNSEITRQALYERAKQFNIPGRSKMNRDELVAAVQAVEGRDRKSTRSKKRK
jgi:hypothetical protein